uniref:GH18 domain-containing protein n=1 Tax=Anopheles atroparvus TaxID=41427 RepID=A0A182IJJ5_ANOAO
MPPTHIGLRKWASLQERQKLTTPSFRSVGHVSLSVAAIVRSRSTVLPLELAFTLADYAAFISSLKTVLDGANLKLATALPYDALANADIYYNPTLPTLPFNVLKTYEDTYAASTTLTHPLSPLFPLSAPFDAESKTISNNLFRWVIKGLGTKNIIVGLPMYSLKFTTSGATAFGGAATAVVKDTTTNYGSTNYSTTNYSTTNYGSTNYSTTNYSTTNYSSTNYGSNNYSTTNHNYNHCNNDGCSCLCRYLRCSTSMLRKMSLSPKSGALRLEQSASSSKSHPHTCPVQLSSRRFWDGAKCGLWSPRPVPPTLDQQLPVQVDELGPGPHVLRVTSERRTNLIVFSEAQLASNSNSTVWMYSGATVGARRAS